MLIKLFTFMIQVNGVHFSQQLEDLLSVYLPELQIESGSLYADFIINYEEGQAHIEGSLESKFIYYRAPNLDDLPHLLYCIARWMWHQNDLFLVHAACVEGLLICGLPGSGKTTMAIAHGGEIMGANATLLSLQGDMVACAGTKMLSLPHERAQESEYKIRGSYLGRDYFLLPDMQMTVISQKIKKIFWLKSGPNHCNEIIGLAKQHLLYPHLFDSLHAHCLIGGYVIAPRHEEQAGKYLAARLDALLPGIPVYELGGDIEWMKEQIRCA